MINPFEIRETIDMIDKENLDIRTITMGISLKSCAGPDIDTVCEKVYNKIVTYAQNLVKTGEDIENQFGIPIINKRISVTPIASLVDALEEPNTEKCVRIAKTLDKATTKDKTKINNVLKNGKCENRLIPSFFISFEFMKSFFNVNESTFSVSLKMDSLTTLII